MTADVHRDPERLERLARSAAGLLDLLAPLPDLGADVRHRLAALPGGADLLRDIDDLRRSVGRGAREIDDLAAVLASAATSAARADVDAAADFRRIGDQL